MTRPDATTAEILAAILLIFGLLRGASGVIELRAGRGAPGSFTR